MELTQCHLNKNETELHVEWLASATSCSIKTYILDYEIKQLWNSDTESGSGLLYNNTIIIVDNPNPYTKYYYRVVAETSGGIQSTEVVCDLTTDEAGGFINVKFRVWYKYTVYTVHACI